MIIGIVAGSYPTEKYLQSGIFAFDQAKALASKGHVVIFLVVDLRSLRKWRKWGFESLTKERVNIEAINIPLGPIPACVLNCIGILGLKVLLKRVEKKYGKPEIIHAHFTAKAYYALKAIEKIPVVMTEHSSAVNKDDIPPRLKEMASYVYSQVDAVFAVSPALQQRIKKTFGIDAIYIPNIVDLEAFKYEVSPKKSEVFTIVSVGNLIPLKRMNRLIEGFALFVRDNPNSVLEIFGDGPDKNNLEQLIREKGLERKVLLRGQQSREVIGMTLREADCFALVSSSETFGVVYIEALASGVPVIATRCGGPEGFVHEGNGLLIPVDDQEALVNALLYMKQNAGSFDRERIAEETRNLFSPDVIAQQLEDQYKRLI